MSDPFYVNRGEIKHNLSRLTASLQKLHSSPGGGPIENEASHAAHLQNTVKIITELEHQLKDLADTFAIQLTNAKKLGLTFEELTTRKDIVETHQRAFDTMREEFAYRVKGNEAVGGNSAVVVNELYSQRQTSQRRYELESKENMGYHGNRMNMTKEAPLRQAEPSRESMHEMKQQLEEDDDDDLVEVYEKKGSAVGHVELGLPSKTANNRRNPGVVSEWMTHHFPLTNRRNRIIFFSFPVALIVIIAVIILAVTLSGKS